ncbi:MAG: chromophore lyase CpcT/CpeT, partial [Phycisphaerae bacterium]|nr:chromophore lyase CpcT/CpeT [Phycisphaerae bacterium]
MTMKNTLHGFVGAGLVMIAGSGALAQDSKPAAPAPAPVPAPVVEKPAPAQPVWTDEVLGKIGDMLAGTWKTEKPVQEVGGGASIDIVMAVTPVAISGLPNALYVESARADAMHLPYRQSILQLYRSKDKIRMRTLDPHSIAAQTGIGAWVGLWAAKELLPQATASVTASDFIGTLDVVLTPGGGGWKGATAYPYPTASGGAVEMTSELTLTSDTFTTGDRGLDAEGKEVWGAPAGGYVFKRYNVPITVRRASDGVTTIDYAHPEDGL